MYNSTAKSYSELLAILEHMEQKYIDMLPKELLELFEIEKDKKYIPSINPNISLAEQKLQKKTYSILAMLNLNYWCENENEKQELIAIYAENDRKKEEELREKYNPNNLFKNQTVIKTQQEMEQSTELIEYKESNFIRKILNKIMKFFRKK